MRRSIRCGASPYPQAGHPLTGVCAALALPRIGRRTAVVGIFPGDASLIRLANMLPIDQNKEWLVGRRYLSAASMGSLLEEGAPSPHR
jgi:hypothetical protein